MEKSYPKTFLTVLTLLFIALSISPFTIFAATAADTDDGSTQTTAPLVGMSESLAETQAFYVAVQQERARSNRTEDSDGRPIPVGTPDCSGVKGIEAMGRAAAATIQNRTFRFSSQEDFNKAKNDPNGPLSFNILSGASATISGYLSQQAISSAGGCTPTSPAAVLPQTVNVIIAGPPKCKFDDNGITGTYRGGNYSLKYKVTGKTLTWFGGPNDSGVTAKETGSVNGKNLRGASGNYAAYPLASLLPAGAKVILGKLSYRGENNAATNSVLSGKCLHICKVDTVKDKKVKAELWLPIADRGPRGDLKNKIDVSPAAYKSLQNTLGLKSLDNLTGFDVALENCK